jgi:hypothetical protein
VNSSLSEPELATKSAAIVAELKSIIAEAELPTLRAVINAHAVRCITVNAAAALERAGEAARAAAESAFAQRQAAEGVHPKQNSQFTRMFLSRL